MDLEILPAACRAVGRAPAPLEFGRQFTAHMLSVAFDAGRGWHSARIAPYHPLVLDPAALVFHYGQEVFEGVKAFATAEGLALFRPADHMLRLNRSARRLSMPEVDVDFSVRALAALVDLDRDELPAEPGSALYLRPTMIATEVGLGLRPAQKFLFFCVVSPVGPFYAGAELEPVAIHVSEQHVRAVRGGVGDVKVGGNYAASLAASEAARAAGCVQTLWLDALERTHVEEVGTMNVFFLFDDVLVTPELSGTILPGITRNSVLRLARGLGYRAEERPVPLAEVLDGVASGRLREAFGSGTAVGIQPIGTLVRRERRHLVSERAGEFTRAMHRHLTAIQRGTSPLHPEWRLPVGRAPQLHTRTA